MLALGAIGIAYGALIALVQKDLKRLAAYATLSALGFIVFGIFTFTTAGVDGGIYQILNESLAGAALFLLLGFLYERFGTYDMREFGGLAASLPWMVTFFVLTTLALVGLPMLNGFVGEFLILSGGMGATFAHHILWTVIGTTGVILSAAYMLSLVQRIFYGDTGLRVTELPGVPDLNGREHLTLWPLVTLFLLMGIASPFWMHAIDTVGTRIAQTLPQPQKPVNGFEAAGQSQPIAPRPSFVDPALKAAALGKQAPPQNPGARY